MQKVLVFLSVILLTIFSTSFNTLTPQGDTVNWLSVSELQVAYNKNPKPILIDVYTHWCSWCKVMDRDTYSNSNVATYINEHYYAVKFDAETKDSVLWNNKKFGYNAAYRANELALYLTSGQLSFPTTVFFADMSAQPAPLGGYLKPAELEAPLRYFGDGFYKEQNFQDFYKKFSASW